MNILRGLKYFVFIALLSVPICVSNAADQTDPCLLIVSKFFKKIFQGQQEKIRILPNTPIKVGMLDKLALWKKLPASTRKSFNNLLAVDERPNILMAATEFGEIEINGLKIKAHVGGLGTVINDMIQTFPAFLRQHGNKQGKISFVFMAYDGIPKLEEVSKFTVDMGDHVETLRLQKFEHPSGATLYFLDHPLFKRRSIRNPKLNLYQTEETTDLYSGRKEWEEPYTFALFNKGIAQVQEYIGANIYHAHDYHTALAPVYMKTDTVAALTIHNAGPSYQGLYWTKDFGDTRIPHPDYPNGIPSGDLASHEKLLDILGIDLDTHLKYFEHNDNGDFAFIKGAKFIGENNLIEGMPVSTGYADELMMSQEEVVEKIKLEKGASPKNLEKIYIPNGGVKFSVLDGIENGLDEKYRAATHPALAKRSPEELATKLSESIKNNEVRQEWLNDLHFGQNLDSAAGIVEVHQKKALLKSMLQKEAGLEVNPDKPLFVLVSRVSSQKHISVLALNIKHIIDQGGQVIVGGKIADPKDLMGVQTAKILKQLENNADLKGQMKYFDTYVDRDLGALIMSGGDFFPMTSKFEPCGLADIEAAWLGTIPVTRKTGGLGKITHGFTYEWADTTDEKGEVLAFRKTLDDVMKFYKESPDQFKQMRIDAMKENFSWKVALSRYFENYRTASLYKIIKELNEQTKTNAITLEQAQKIVDTVFAKLPDDLIENFKRVLLKKTDPTPLEKSILEGHPGREALIMDLMKKTTFSFSAAFQFYPPAPSYRMAWR